MNLARLTAAKAVANTALRWVPPFLPTLERAFGATTQQLTTIIGLGEMAGLSTIGVGRHLDRGRGRIVMAIALVIVSISSLVALVGTTASFAVSFVLVILGVANLTVAGHAHISARVAYAARARAIGLYETSWALALLVGAPLVAVLIDRFGWRGPYVALAVATAAMAVLIGRSTDGGPVEVAAPSPVPTAAPVGGSDGRTAAVGRSGSDVRSGPVDDPLVDRPGVTSPPSGGVRIARLPARAWAVVAGSALLAMAGLSVFAISGSWLDEAFGVSTGGLGAVAMGYGAIELAASSGSAGVADRLGKLRSTLLGVGALVGGLAIMSLAGGTLWIGVVGILVFLGGFEFAFVTSLSLVTEATPSARGTTIALANGVGTVARGTGTIASGLLFGAHGVGGPIVLSGAAALGAAGAFTLSRRAPS